MVATDDESGRERRFGAIARLDGPIEVGLPAARWDPAGRPAAARGVLRSVPGRTHEGRTARSPPREAGGFVWPSARPRGVEEAAVGALRRCSDARTVRGVTPETDETAVFSDDLADGWCAISPPSWKHALAVRSATATLSARRRSGGGAPLGSRACQRAMTLTAARSPSDDLDTNELLKPYVPRLVINWLRDDAGRSPPGARELAALRRHLGLHRAHGTPRPQGEDRRRADARHPRRGLRALLDEAYDWGAGLLKWGGDALLLLFDGPGS